MGLLPVIGVVHIANHFIYMSTWVYSRLLMWSVLLIILFIRVHGFTPSYWCGPYCQSFYLYEYMGLLPVIGVVHIANHFIYMSTWVYCRLLVWSVLLIVLFIRVHGFTAGYWCGPYCLSFYLYEYMSLLPVIGVVRIANHFIYTSTWVYSQLLVWSVLLIILFIWVHEFTPGYWCGPYC